MQRPSWGEWIAPLILSSATLVTAWSWHNMVMPLWLSGLLYVALLGAAVWAHLHRMGEYKKWVAANSVVMKSHLAIWWKPSMTGGQPENAGEFCFFRVINLFSKKVKVTNFWLEGCLPNKGERLFVDDSNLPKALEAGDDYEFRISRSRVQVTDWHDKARARLSDGSIVSSSEDKDVPEFGNISS